MTSKTMRIQDMCGFLKNSSSLILSTAHGGTSDTGPVYVNVPVNAVIIEVGVATHSTWQSMSPKIIKYFQNICRGGSVPSNVAGRAARCVLDPVDIRIIEDSIRIYKGEGGNTQVYNMTFSHEDDQRAFIRQTNYANFCNPQLDTDAAYTNYKHTRPGDKLTMIHGGTGQWNHDPLSYKIIIGKGAELPPTANKYVILTISCKPSVAQEMKKGPAEILLRLGRTHSFSDEIKLLNLLVHVQHMMNGIKLLEGVAGKDLKKMEENLAHRLIALHEYFIDYDPSIYYARTIIEQSATLSSAASMDERIEQYLDNYIETWIEPHPIDEATWTDNEKLEFINTQLNIFNVLLKNRKAKFVTNRWPDDWKNQDPVFLKGVLIKKFISVQRKIMGQELTTIEQAIEIALDPKGASKPVFDKMEYGTKMAEVGKSLIENKPEDAISALSEIYSDWRGTGKDDDFKDNIRDFIRHLSDYPETYPCDNEDGNLYKVLKDLMTEMQLCLCRFCGCSKGKTRCKPGGLCVPTGTCPGARIGSLRGGSKKRKRKRRSRERPSKKRKKTQNKKKKTKNKKKKFKKYKRKII